MDIDLCVSFIKTYIKNYNRRSSSIKLFRELCERICYVLIDWCGNTWVGREKSMEDKELYQNFFNELNSLINFLDSNASELNIVEKEFTKSVIYRGTIYRLLGSCDSLNKSKIRPRFDDIFVSWSKNKENNYLESKLYGPITRLYGEIDNPDFGIDIEGFTVFYHKHFSKDVMIARGDEREVVFPTIRKYTHHFEFLRVNENE